MSNKRKPLKDDEYEGERDYRQEDRYNKQIAELELSIKRAHHQIQVLKTRRKLQVLEDGGQLCSTCNGIMEYAYGNPFSKFFHARCEDCKQTNFHKLGRWSEDPAEWPEDTQEWPELTK